MYFDPRQSRNDLEILLQFGVSAFEPFLCGLRGPTVTGEILQLFRRHHPRLSIAKDPNQVRVQTAASEPYLGLVQAVSGLLSGLVQAVSGLLSGLVQALDWPFSGLVALEENLDSTFICLRSSVLFGIVWRSGGSGVTVNRMYWMGRTRAREIEIQIVLNSFWLHVEMFDLFGCLSLSTERKQMVCPLFSGDVCVFDRASNCARV